MFTSAALSSIHEFLCQAFVSPSKTGLKSNHKAVVYPQKFVLLPYSWKYLLPLVVIVVHMIPRRARLLIIPPQHSRSPHSNFWNYENYQKGGSFLVSINVIHPFIVTSSCGVFINKVLPSSTGWQWRAMTMTHFVLGVVRDNSGRVMFFFFNF